MSKVRSKRIAICLVTDHKDNILMGLRNDSGLYTLPGGHLEPGEDPYEGCVREFTEETGLDVQDLKLVGSHWDKEQGLLLYLFKIYIDFSQSIDTSGDPDQECDHWYFIDPNSVKDELHIPIERNIALQYWIKN